MLVLRNSLFLPRSQTEGLGAHSSMGNFIAWFAGVADGMHNERGALPSLQAVILRFVQVADSRNSAQNDGRFLDFPPPGFATFAVPQPQPLSHDFPPARFRNNRTTKNATAPVMIAATAS